MRVVSALIFALLCAEISLAFKISPTHEIPSRNPISNLLLSATQNKLNSAGYKDNQTCIVKPCVGEGQQCSQYIGIYFFLFFFFVS